MQDDQAFHIAFATGLESDLRYLAALMQSIARNSSRPERIVFHILHFQLGTQELAPLRESVSALSSASVFYPMDEALGDRVKKPFFGYWARVWIPTVLDSTIERVLYLDCDMICHRELSSLWELSLEENFVAAVLDPGTRVLGVSQSLSQSAPLYGYQFPPDANYFNSGLLFMNLRVWREESVLETLEERFDYRPQRFNDQDALNLLFQNRVLFISPEWNLIESIHLYEHWDFQLYSTYDPPHQYFQPRLRHYSGKMKPDGLYVRETEAQDFYHQLDKTVWKGWRSEISSKWYRPILGHLLDFHYLVVRGLKQRAVEQPRHKLWEVTKRAPYTPLLYLLIPIYRAVRLFRSLAVSLRANFKIS